jgi:hypothetical protein
VVFVCISARIIRRETTFPFLFAVATIYEYQTLVENISGEIVTDLFVPESTSHALQLYAAIVSRFV